VRCLWLTPQVPYPPFRGGDALYSAGLIESLAEAGVQITVVCHDNGGGDPPQIPNVDWDVLPATKRSRLGSVLDRQPSITHRFSTPAIRRLVRTILARKRYDAIVIDTLAMANSVDESALARSGVRTVYVSHNHEASIRGAIARSMSRVTPMGIALRWDAMKASAAERRVVEWAELITATSVPDAELFARGPSATECLVLTPGYSGPKVASRVIDAHTPRRVVILGTYHWIAKQFNLTKFLRVAAEPLSGSGIGIDVVGSIPDRLVTSLRHRHPMVRFVGAVDDASSYLASARLGVVAEEIGGGFKLKALDYVFNRVPIAALRGSVAEMPLKDGASILETSTVAELAEAIERNIDDFVVLNGLQNAAFLDCAGQFAWVDRGRRLRSALGGVAAARN
jgi:glycosyltransferase involved in cell wall biosynthesis